MLFPLQTDKRSDANLNPARTFQIDACLRSPGDKKKKKGKI